MQLVLGTLLASYINMNIVNFDVNIKPMLNHAIVSILFPIAYTELRINHTLKTNVKKERTLLTL